MQADSGLRRGSREEEYDDEDETLGMFAVADAGPDVRPSHQRDPDEPSHLDRFRSLKLHRAGVSVSGFRIVDCSIFPPCVIFPGKSGHEYQANDWSLSFARIRIVDVQFFLAFRGLRFFQRDNFTAQFPLVFEYLESGIFISPNSDGRRAIERRR
jgi:hypothetical protein